MKHRVIFGVAVLLSCVFLWQAPCAARQVLLEAESFADTGGWLVDQQAMDIMGSPYLIAHGMGEPVADAAASVVLPSPGPWRVWVRTRDWTAPWNAPESPGRFQVLINGKPLDPVFGVEGAEWHWQDGGTVECADAKIAVALHDLTGFAGRCDALLFSDDPGFVPPDDVNACAALRRSLLALPDTPEEAGPFDFVVVGGGMAGVCAAVTAARLGLETALIHDRPVVGGNNSSEVRVHLNGEINLPPYPALGDVVKELDSGKKGNAQPADFYGDQKKLDVLWSQPKLHPFLNTHACRVEKRENRIAAVIAVDIRTGRENRFTAPLFADCTGDGTLGFLAGADFRMGREGRAETGETLAPETPDKMTMGASAQWYSVDAGAPSPFPECPWAMAFTEESCQPVTRGDWDWEAGLNMDQVRDIERVRDHLFRAIYGNWSFLKNHHPDRAKFANLKLGWMAHVAGKRESRRLMGDLILAQQDLEEPRLYPDSCVTTTWTIDLHYPKPENSRHFPGMEFRTIAEQVKIKPYPVPYRCFYSRNVENLFMAGRNISVTHVALGTIRVMRTGGMMGEVVGMAASLCKQHGTSPRGVYEKRLEELKALMNRGAGRAALSGGA